MAEVGSGETIVIPGLGAIEVLYSGKEDMTNDSGDEMMILFAFNGSVYKKMGFDNSYGGRAWDGALTKANQVTKTITVWE